VKTVLVVEDDKDICALVAMILEQRGYAVDIASNGLEALDCLERRRSDLILLDIKMPGMSGPEFAVAYRARTAAPERAPIVVMTAADHAALRAQEIAAADFLAKPFSVDELVRVVRAHTPNVSAELATGG
jgi:DNA-binding response OmpR family regulator